MQESRSESTPRGRSGAHAPVRLAAAGLALALSLGTLAACGSSTTKSTTGTGSSSSTATSSSSNTGSQYAAYYKVNGTATVTAGKPLTVDMGDLWFKPNTITVAKGTPVTIDLVNTASSTTHNFSLDAFKVNVTVNAGAKGTAKFTPTQAGTYYFYCNVPGHAQGGMVGKLIVK